MVLKLRYFILFILFCFLTQNLLSNELSKTERISNKQYIQDCEETLNLLNELDSRIYESDIDHKQLKFFKEEVVMAQNLFKMYLILNNNKINAIKSILTKYENKQNDANIEIIHKDVSLYHTQKEKIKQYKFKRTKIHDINIRLDKLLFEILNRHVQINDTQSNVEYEKNFTFTRDLLNVMERRINHTTLDQGQIKFFKDQLILLTKIFEKYLITYKNKIKFWNHKLREFEINHQKPSLKEAREALSIYQKRQTKFKQSKQQIINIEKILKRVEVLLNILVNRHVRVSDRLLFKSSTKFYDFKSWSLGSDDIFLAMEKIFSSIKQSSLINQFTAVVVLWLIILMLYCFSLKWINRLVLKLCQRYILFLDSVQDLFYINKVITIILFGVIPSHIIYLFVTSFSIPLSNKADSFVFALLFNFVCSISFVIVLYSLLISFIQSTLKHKYFNYLFLCSIIFLILLNNNINAFSFSKQFYPFIDIYGVSLINLLIFVVLAIWGVNLLYRYHNKLRVTGKLNIYIKSWILCLQAILILNPICIFIGYSNFIVAFLVNSLQTVIIIYVVYLIYMVCVELTSITSARIYSYYLQRTRSSKYKQHVVQPSVVKKIPSFRHLMYWLKFLFIILISIVLIWLIALEWGVPPLTIEKFLNIILYSPFPIRENSLFSLYRLISAVFILLCCYGFTLIIGALSEIKILKHSTAGTGTRYAVKMIIRYLGIVISLIIFVYALGVDSKSMTFVISGLSVGVGFALKDTLSNFFSGIIILVGRKIRVGDWIYSTESELEGNIEHIGLHSTVIRGFDKRVIIAPNFILNSQSIVNASRMSHRRIKQFFGIRYEDIDVVNEIISSIKDMLILHHEIDSSMKTVVKLVDGDADMGSTIEGCFGGYSINIQIYAYTKTTHWIKFNEVQDEVMLAIADIIKKYGAEIAFPSSNVALSMVK